MSRERAICGVIAFLCHAALLFGFRIGRLPVPLPISDEPVEVSLVAGEPAPAPVAPEATPAPPPPPPVAAPVPEPIPEPTPKPEPIPEPMPKPATPPSHPEPPKPERVASSTPRKAAPATTAIGGAADAIPTATSGTGGLRGISTAHPHFNPKPPYPPEARRLRQEGRVLLQVAVNAEGRATNVSVIRSSGVPSLDESAVTTVRHWTFEPARLAGVAVASRVEVPVAFTLSN